jgi:hypothetical protein
MPLDNGAAQIKVRPGARWIDADIIAQFATETLGAGEVTADHLNGQWSIECPKWQRRTVAMTKTFGTSHIDAVDLLNAVCNSKAVVVERPKEDIELVRMICGVGVHGLSVAEAAIVGVSAGRDIDYMVVTPISAARCGGRLHVRPQFQDCEGGEDDHRRRQVGDRRDHCCVAPAGVSAASPPSRSSRSCSARPPQIPNRSW